MSVHEDIEIFLRRGKKRCICCGLSNQTGCGFSTLEKVNKYYRKYRSHKEKLE
jgi:hypothetical protein